MRSHTARELRRTIGENMRVSMRMDTRKGMESLHGMMKQLIRGLFKKGSFQGKELSQTKIMIITIRVSLKME